jgi:hypothetical protein
MISLKCAGKPGCDSQIAYIDVKGFLYCIPCGIARKLYCRARKLTPIEIRKLINSETICYKRSAA